MNKFQMFQTQHLRLGLAIQSPPGGTLNGSNMASSFYFSFFSQFKDKYRSSFDCNRKSSEGLIGFRTRGGRMEDSYKTTEV